MHILIIPSWYINSYNSLSGIFFKEQAEALANQNNKLGVLSIQNIGIKTILKAKKISFLNTTYKENGLHTYHVEYPTIPKVDILNRYIKLKIFKKIFKKYIKKNGIPDIIHLHSFGNGHFAIYLKENYNIPYIVTEHSSSFAQGSISKGNLNFASKVYESASYNIAVSRKLKKLLESKYNASFHYLPNIVNTDFFDIKIEKKKENKKFIFINIAALDENKNQKMLIHSFYNSFQDNGNVKLIIVGDGPDYRNLANLTKELKLDKQIALYGKASRKEVKALLQSSDAFVLSSKYETFGIVIIEAMACGLPVVATKCGGPESIITSEKLGLLSEIDAHVFSKKLLEIYNNRFNFDPNYIRRYIKDNFSEKAIIKKLISIYQTVKEAQ